MFEKMGKVLDKAKEIAEKKVSFGDAAIVTAGLIVLTAIAVRQPKTLVVRVFINTIEG